MQTFKDHFHQGQTFEAFVNTGEQEEIAAINKLSEQLKQKGFVSQANLENMLSLTTNVNLLVVGEMFCPDCHVNMAALNYLTLKQEKIKLSIITRDYAREHLPTPLALTEIKIPLVVCLNESYQLMPADITKNLFIERPTVVKSVADFDEIKTDYLAGAYLNDTLNEILAKL